MTVEQIVKQTRAFTTEQKQELAYYMLFPTIKEDKKKDFMNFFNFNIFNDWKNKLPKNLVINEDEFYN